MKRLVVQEITYPHSVILRVKVRDDQAIIAFPKYGVTYGIGFEKEEKERDRNLACQFPAEVIYDHIAVNIHGATKRKCIEAIKLLQDAIYNKGLARKPTPDEQAFYEKLREDAERIADELLMGKPRTPDGEPRRS